MAPWAKNPPIMQELRVRSPDEKVPLEEEMAIHSNIFAWEILWTEEPGGFLGSCEPSSQGYKSQTRLTD